MKRKHTKKQIKEVFDKPALQESYRQLTARLNTINGLVNIQSIFYCKSETETVLDAIRFISEYTPQ